MSECLYVVCAGVPISVYVWRQEEDIWSSHVSVYIPTFPTHLIVNKLLFIKKITYSSLIENSYMHSGVLACLKSHVMMFEYSHYIFNLITSSYQMTSKALE